MPTLFYFAIFSGKVGVGGKFALILALGLGKVTEIGWFLGGNV